MFSSARSYSRPLTTSTFQLKNNKKLAQGHVVRRALSVLRVYSYAVNVNVHTKLGD